MMSLLSYMVHNHVFFKLQVIIVQTNTTFHQCKWFLLETMYIHALYKYMSTQTPEYVVFHYIKYYSRKKLVNNFIHDH